MSTPNPSLSTSPPPGTLAWVLHELPNIPDLSAQARQNLSSSIRRLCEVLERSPIKVPANLRALETLFERASPGALGLSSTRWRNIKSDVRRAVKLTVKHPPVPDTKVPLTDVWEALCQSAPNPTLIAVLRRFGRFCCARKIRPDQVTDSLMNDFIEYLDDHALSKSPERIQGDTIRAWNRYTASGGLPRLTPINRSRAYIHKWEDFPPSLKRDVDAFHEACLKPDPFDPDAPPQVKLSTIDQRDRMIRRFATAAVEQGGCANELVGLRALITPDRVKKALTFFYVRKGDKASTHAHEMAKLAVTIAKYWLKLDEEDVRKLRGYAKKLGTELKEVKPGGLSEKNEARLRQFRDEGVLRKLFTLPDKIIAGELKKTPDSRSALRIQTALAIDILLVAPMRIENLRSLDRDDHFVRAFSDKDPILQISIKAEDVKNNVELIYPVPDDVYDHLELYMNKYQPLLTNGHPSSLLFPGRFGTAKAANSLRRNITNMIWKELGLHVNPHLFRHIAAHLFLGRNPGHYEDVRRILNHKSIQTTIDSYAGLEAVTSLKRYDDVVLDLKKGVA